jgi:hypothetical protein
VKAGKLIAYYETGEGKILFLEEFTSCEPLLRLDILSDWKDQIDEEYRRALADMRKQWTEARKNRPHRQGGEL